MNAGDLMKTTDSGRTWRRVGSPCRRGWGGFAWAAAISFVSQSRGWVLCKGQPGTGSQSKALYLTTDGGSRWTQLVNAHFEPGRVRLRGLQARGYPEGMTSPEVAEASFGQLGVTRCGHETAAGAGFPSP